VEVVGLTAEFLSSHAARNGVLVRSDGETLTVGDVKQRINLWLAERDAEAPEGFIFAIGRDPGVPHSSGTDSDPIALGKTIVYDIFPWKKAEATYDFTDWCGSPGLPNPPRRRPHNLRYRDGSLKAGAETSIYQEQTCKPVQIPGPRYDPQDPATQQGYVHSLGHGLGLNILKRPGSAASHMLRRRMPAPRSSDRRTGPVLSEQGMGRLEDRRGSLTAFEIWPHTLLTW
jgi:Xaa-Pro aminopeptidase